MADALTTARFTCRACSRPLDLVLDLGTPVLSDFVPPGAPDPPRSPLVLVACDHCGLVQLGHTTNPERLYRQYWYRSAVNEVMRAELADIVTQATLLVGGLSSRDVVIDIGANDGTLLSCYAGGTSTPVRVAYEPAYNLNDALRPHADTLVADFFPKGLKDVAALRTEVKVITAIAMFYDLEDPGAFVEAVDFLLADRGVWVVQMQDLGQMLQATAFDNICHEHLCYYTLTSFERLLRPYDLAISLVERRRINGGSLRFYVQRRRVADEAKWQAFVDQHRAAEAWIDRPALDRFAWRVQQHTAQLVGTIDFFRRQGHPVDLYAASTKGSTLLQYAGIDHTRIRQAVERSPEKWGLETSGTRIPIVSEADWRARPAPIVVLGAWQFRDAFLTREVEYLEQGGSFIVPLPHTELVRHARSTGTDRDSLLALR